MFSTFIQGDDGRLERPGIHMPAAAVHGGVSLSRMPPYDPYDAANGFAQFNTNGSGLHINGHNSYFASQSESLANMANITTGHGVSMVGSTGP